MAKRNIILLMLVLIFVLIVILILQEQPASPAQLQPTETVSPIQRTSVFSLTGTSLTGDQIGVTHSFQVFFSDKISYQDFNYSISPEIKLELSLDPSGKILNVKPEGIWRFETEYTFTILKNSKNIKGQQLEKDTVISFKTAPYSGI